MIQVHQIQVVLTQRILEQKRCIKENQENLVNQTTETVIIFLYYIDSDKRNSESKNKLRKSEIKSEVDPYKSSKYSQSVDRKTKNDKQSQDKESVMNNFIYDFCH